MTVRYTPTPATVATFDTYRFMLSDPAIPVEEKWANDDDRKVLLYFNLFKGITFQNGTV